jgi:hypothetical protein
LVLLCGIFILLNFPLPLKKFPERQVDGSSILQRAHLMTMYLTEQFEPYTEHRPNKCLFIPGAMQVFWLMAMVVPAILADTPANCTFNDVAGKWILYEGSRIHNGSIDCRTMGELCVETVLTPWTHEEQKIAREHMSTPLTSGSLVVKALCYTPEGRGFETR